MCANHTLASQRTYFDPQVLALTPKTEPVAAPSAEPNIFKLVDVLPVGGRLFLFRVHDVLSSNLPRISLFHDGLETESEQLGVSVSCHEGLPRPTAYVDCEASRVLSILKSDGCSYEQLRVPAAVRFFKKAKCTGDHP